MGKMKCMICQKLFDKKGIPEGGISHGVCDEHIELFNEWTFNGQGMTLQAFYERERQSSSDS